MFSRYAIYFLPIGELAIFGTSWLGWDIENGSPTSIENIILPQTLHRLVEMPSKYGFHATVKAPFTLKNNYHVNDISNKLQIISQCHKVFNFPVEIKRVGNFLAIRAKEGDPLALKNLVTDCVEGLEYLRAPLTKDQLKKRLRSNLSHRQIQYVHKFGYPFVLDEYKFHLTLSNELEECELITLKPYLDEHLSPLLKENLKVAAIALVGETHSGKFKHIASFPLGC